MTPMEAARRALALYRENRLDEAEALCRAAADALPDHPALLHLLGTIRIAQGRPAESIDPLRRAIALKPDGSDAHSNLSVALQALHRPDEAMASLERSSALDPETAASYINRGTLHRQRGDRDRARIDFARAALLCPDDPLALTNLGLILREALRVKEAAATLRRAAVLAPGHAEAHLNLAHSLRELGSLPEALRAYSRACVLEPERSETQGYRLLLKQMLCDWHDYDRLCRQVYDTIDRDAGITLPLGILTIDTTAGQQHRSARLFFDRIVSRGQPAVPMPARGGTSGQGRLRIAYLSADFHEHATAYLAAELFERHDRGRFTVLAYSYGGSDGSPMRRRLEAAFDRFHDIQSASADDVARRMAEDGVDIAVDLKGYTKQARFDLLARRLAPVQVSYLGYPGTIGCPHMDYIIGDRFVTPPEHQPHYTERLVLLPDSYQVNDRRRPLPEKAPSRAECGLPEDGFVFCSFNALHKTSPTMFGVWMRLLKRVPGSVLWLYEGAAQAVVNLRREAAERGVDPSRLVFAPKAPLPAHLARYRVADLCVDTLPYTGHTTTSDALWIGCPVVTCMGETFASRVAASLLGAAGVPELVTVTLSDYEDLAVRLAGDRQALSALRRRLEESRMTSPLFDSARFTRHLERAYEIMWRLHAAGRPPQGFALLPPSR